MANLVTKISMALLVVALVSAFMITTTAGCKSEGTWCQRSTECCSGSCRLYSAWRSDGTCGPTVSEGKLVLDQITRGVRGVMSRLLFTYAK